MSESAELIASPSETNPRHPAVPATLAELAALRGQAIEVIEARILILETVRKAAIRATHPEDWLLFRSKDGRITAYLQDCGGDRVRDLYGIEIFNVSEPQKISQNDGSFYYLMRGSGRCKLTGQELQDVEGGRGSNEDFCVDKVGVQKELAVRKAARANLDGNITRELAGLKNVPLEELTNSWSGTNKNADNCHHGRGFGSARQREGARADDGSGVSDDQQKPKCPLCQETMNYRAAGTTKSGSSYGAFWSCPNYVIHKKAGEDQRNYSVQDDVWRKSVDGKPGAAA